MLVLANADLCREREVDYALRRNVVQHIPRGLLIWETVFDVDVGDAAPSTELVKQRAEAALLLNRTFFCQRDPLIGIDEIPVLLVQQVVRLANHTGTVLGWDHLQVKTKLVGEPVFDFVDGVQDLRGKLHRFFRIKPVSEVVRTNQPEHIHDLKHADPSNRTELFIQFHRAVGVVREQSLLDIALDDMAHGVKRFAVQRDPFAQDLKILLHVSAALISNADKVDRTDATGTDGQCRTADAIDKRIELLRVAEEPATVGKHADIVADEEVGIRPLHVMVTTPSGKRFVSKFPVLEKQGVRKNWECKHIDFSGLADHFHEQLLEFDQIFNMVDGECSVRENRAAEQRLQIRTVKNGNVCEGTLISIVFSNRSHWSYQSINRIPTSFYSRSDCPIF